MVANLIFCRLKPAGVGMHARRVPRGGNAGFTLIELMVTLAVLAILATLAAPSFNDFLIRNRTAAIANEFTASVLRARSEAVSRNMCVTMCRATGGSCTTTGGWETGWLTFANPTCDATINTPTAADTIGSAGPFDGAFSMASNATNADRMVFSPTGNARAGDAGRFDLQFQTSGTTRASNRGVCLSRLGRTHLVAFGGTCP